LTVGRARLFIQPMAAKSYAEMTLDEVFELEGRHTANIGRSVVTERGIERNRTRLGQEIRRLLRERKSRRPRRHAAA
jgi:hypothetical protein